MQLVDTHCHIHSADYSLDAQKVYQAAITLGVMKLICVGTDVDDSKQAAEWAYTHENSWASVGVHPHEAKNGIEGLENLLQSEKLSVKIVAIGEIGLDYHYMHSPREQQVAAFEAQLQLAVTHDLPVIFHVRESFDDFWAVLKNFQSAGQRIKGVVHSFTDAAANLQQALEHGLYIGVNGIVTFPASKDLQSLLGDIPLHKLLLETDAPYLTPAPYRGKVNEPAYVRLVAEYIGQARHISLEELAAQTSRNATILFHI
jgi:TatD DNase family protein